MKILGIGNALVDIMTRLENDVFLKEVGLPKGSMQLINNVLSDNLLEASGKFKTKITSGGSAANTIHGLANLKMKTGFIGKLGDDTYGQLFIEDIQKNNVIPHIQISKNLSGKAIAFISPDGERTFATFLGVASELNISDIEEAVLSSYGCIHIEGYLLQNHELIEGVVKKAKQLGLIVSLDVASYNIVEENREFLLNLIPNNVDILFANEEEAFALTGLREEDAVIKMAKLAPTAILKLGAKGSIIHDGTKLTKIEAIDVNCIDTTGAGDLYASGFLYGYVKGLPIETSGKIASLLSGKVTEVIGAKLSDIDWEYICEELEKLGVKL
jgi:sugar/nucleoside kinase (ribokinase family)